MHDDPCWLSLVLVSVQYAVGEGQCGGLRRSNLRRARSLQRRPRRWRISRRRTNGESNAHARYLAFAEKADEEGYTGVGSLFRAAAHSEEIHAANHAKVIKSLGAAPKADVKAPEAKTTAENLKAAIAGETYERDVMYPEFVSKAKAEGNSDAVRSFNLCSRGGGWPRQALQAGRGQPGGLEGRPAGLLRL